MAQFAAIASTVLSAGAKYGAGRAADNAARFEAAQLRQNAGQQRAAAQRQAIEERRQSTLAQSRLRALAGGGGGDPTVVDLAGDIGAAGEYRALTALYQGEQAAKGMELAAVGRRYEGRMAKRAGTTGAISSILSGGNDAGMFGKYGNGGAGGQG